MGLTSPFSSFFNTQCSGTSPIGNEGQKEFLVGSFFQNKPFALQGKYYLSRDISSSDITARLQLLTIHFPKLRILWSPRLVKTGLHSRQSIAAIPDCMGPRSILIYPGPCTYCVLVGSTSSAVLSLFSL